MDRGDYEIRFCDVRGYWHSFMAPKGALDNVTYAQADTYLGQWMLAHQTLKCLLVRKGS